MVAFQSLGELSGYLSSSPADFTVVDPGIPLLGYEPRSVEALRRHPSVRKVTDFIARSVAGVPFHLYERVGETDRQRVSSGPVADMLRSPDVGVPPVRFWRDVMMDRLLWDRFCLIPVEDDGALRLVRIPAKKFTFESDGLGRVEAVKIVTDRGTKTIEAENAVIDVGFSPSGCNGLSPLETLADVLTEAEESISYSRQLWRHGARVPTVVTRPVPDPTKGQKPWNRDARRNFLNQLEDYKRRGAKAGSILLLEDGMRMESTNAFSPKDALDLDGRKLADIEVAAAFHVPPELVGAREGNYSNIEAFRQMLYREVCGPWIQGIEQALNTQLLPSLDDTRSLYIEANLEAALRGSFTEQAKYGQISVGAPVMTRNEYRARMNLPRLDGGDELITPLNVVEGGLASPADTDGHTPERDANA